MTPSDPTRPAHAVVDLSNVCRSHEIPPTDVRWGVMARLAEVEAAWHAAYGPDARLTLVADDSLAHVLYDRREEDAYQRLIRQRRVRIAPDADAVFLDIAQREGCYVLSRDRFVDKRSEFPYIEAHPERFLSWRMTDAGLRLCPSGIVPVSRRTVSAAVEGKDARRFANVDLRSGREMLRTLWICPGDCVDAQMWPDGLRVWPVNEDGVAVCRTCRSRLRAVGKRRTLRQIKVLRASDEKEIMRFPLEEDAALVMGRGALSEGVNLAMCDAEFHEAVSRISRQHVLIDLQVDARSGAVRLVAVDLDSRNGTKLLRSRGPNKSRAGGVPLEPAAHTVFGEPDWLLLGGRVLIEVSARQFVVDAELPVNDGRGEWTTELVTNPATGFDKAW